MNDLQDLQNHLKKVLTDLCPPLSVRKDNEQVFEVAGTKPAMQGKQKVDGYYFASVVPKPKDIRLYFFPIYTHADAFELSEDLKKLLKGKSCFHLKNVNEKVLEEIEKMIKKGIHLYEADDLI